MITVYVKENINNRMNATENKRERERQIIDLKDLCTHITNELFFYLFEMAEKRRQVIFVTKSTLCVWFFSSLSLNSLGSAQGNFLFWFEIQERSNHKKITQREKTRAK